MTAIPPGGSPTRESVTPTSPQADKPLPAGTRSMAHVKERLSKLRNDEITATVLGHFLQQLADRDGPWGGPGSYGAVTARSLIRCGC